MHPKKVFRLTKGKGSNCKTPIGLSPKGSRKMSRKPSNDLEPSEPDAPSKVDPTSEPIVIAKAHLTEEQFKHFSTTCACRLGEKVVAVVHYPANKYKFIVTSSRHISKTNCPETIVENRPSTTHNAFVAENDCYLIELERPLPALNPSAAVSALHRLMHYNNQHINFETIQAEELNFDAFRKNKKGNNRQPRAAKKAQERATSNILQAIEDAGTQPKQALALHKALLKPAIQLVAKMADFKAETMDFQYSCETIQSIPWKALHTATYKRECCADCNDFVDMVLTTCVAPEASLDDTLL
jgi:hypothetical protein